MKVIGMTRASELNCNECLDRVAEYAELDLAGKAIPDALESVGHHLELCQECHEEYLALKSSIANLGGEGT